MSEVAAPGSNGGYVRHLAALSMAMLVPSLGTSIANVALPSFEMAFGASFQDVQWIVLAYLVAVTALIVAAGRLGDVLGRRPILLGGILLFTLGSVAGILAPTLWVLVALRGLQGIGAAAMMALTVAAVSDVIPKDRTGAAMGWLGTVSAVGTALGPIIGGLLISWLGWRGLFGAMALAGILALWTGFAVLPANTMKKQNLADFDWIGTLLLAASLSAFALATTIGAANSLTLMVVLLVLAALGIAGFLVFEARASAPLLKLRLLREPGVGASLLAMAVVSAIVMTTLVAGPFFLSKTLKLNVEATGLAMSVGPLVAALVGAPAGRLVDRAGSARIAIAGRVGVTVGSILMVVLPGTLAVVGYVIALATITAGYAVFQAANTTTIMAGVSQDQRGVASALLGVSRNLGLIAGASAMGTVFAGAAANGFGPLAPGGDTGLAVAFAAVAIFAAISTVMMLGQRLDRST